MKNLFTVSIILLSVSLEAQVFNITSFGAVGNGSTMNTTAIQAAVDSCNHAGGGIVEVPAGNFLTATVFLKSNVTIHLAAGATITGSGTTSDYPDVVPLIRSYADNYTKRSVFYAEGQHNIGITGEGTFQGNGLSFSFLTDASHKPYGFRFISCTNVIYEGITLRNSGFWMMHNQNIDTLVIKNITIINQNFGNGDGISIDGCKNVIVDSCTADCNDDPLVIKTTSLSSSENISISNCMVSSYSRAIKIGTETHGAFKNIHLNNITVQFSTQGPFGSNNPAKCGINLSVVDGGSMDNVLIENVTMEGIKVPLLIRLGNRAHKYTDTASTPGVGFLRNVELRNITATATTNVTSSITGIPNYYAKDIRLNNVDITFPGGQAAVSPGFIVPENISSGPEATIFGDTLPAAGLYLRHVDSIQLHNVCFHPVLPDGRPTLVLDDVLNLDSSGVCITTNIAEESNEDVFRVFPNPMSNELIISGLSFTEVRIFDATGRVVYSSIPTGKEVKIKTGNWTKGVYLARIAYEKKIITRKLIKE